MSNQDWIVFGAIVVGIVAVIGVFFNPFDEEGATDAQIRDEYVSERQRRDVHQKQITRLKARLNNERGDGATSGYPSSSNSDGSSKL